MLLNIPVNVSRNIPKATAINKPCIGAKNSIKPLKI
jgi:hypothetical protein